MCVNCVQAVQRRLGFKGEGVILSSAHLFEFLDLGLFEHGEHIGVGSLRRPLLGFLGGLLAQIKKKQKLDAFEIQHFNQLKSVLRRSL